MITTRHTTRPDLPGVQLQVYDDEVLDVYRALVAVLLRRFWTCRSILLRTRWTA
ncbi:hypothetical protein [Amycolatopsis sp. FDAARGOS 1241]|uniref:hypothetical protein n=1 Tax=Amycolatopsis sp. FDAARGOS 1241 TaxID=2778070 RepID=UPI001EF375EE|nr:hypothetical protein [Amycolatopsis sp. FDAARGOS 1241]